MTEGVLKRLLAVTGLLLPLLLAPGRAEAAHPRVLDHMGRVTAVALVTTPGWRSTRGTLALWQRTNGTWRTVRSGIPVWVGRNGFQYASRRHEGDGTSPAGRFPMRFAFGAQPNPGARLAWTQLHTNSCWSGERADYNTYVRRTCTSRDENLWASRRTAYRYAAVVGFNDSPAVWGRGSAIFLHVSLGKATSGCVSMAESNLLTTLRWMPRGAWIVMGPQAYVNTL